MGCRHRQPAWRVYTSEPQLNFEVVERVRDAVSVPLVLHGAWGWRDADIKTAISLGIAKLDINTELCSRRWSQ
ncbi:class II fructose-bisphosphate aldolase [Shigella flexneri]